MSRLIFFVAASQVKAEALVSEGYLPALVGCFDELAEYWEGMLRDFPRHPVRDYDPQLRRAIGCTLYGDFVAISSAEY